MSDTATAIADRALKASANSRAIADEALTLAESAQAKTRAVIGEVQRTIADAQRVIQALADDRDRWKAAATANADRAALVEFEAKLNAETVAELSAALRKERAARQKAELQFDDACDLIVEIPTNDGHGTRFVTIEAIVAEPEKNGAHEPCGVTLCGTLEPHTHGKERY